MRKPRSGTLIRIVSHYFQEGLIVLEHPLDSCRIEQSLKALYSISAQTSSPMSVKKSVRSNLLILLSTNTDSTSRPSIRMKHRI